MPDCGKTPGQIAYDAQSVPCMGWDYVHPDLRAEWERVAKAVLDAFVSVPEPEPVLIVNRNYCDQAVAQEAKAKHTCRCGEESFRRYGCTCGGI